MTLRFVCKPCQRERAACSECGERWLRERRWRWREYHIERYDPLLNEAFVWVKVPELKPGAQTAMWLYYGNTGPKAVPVNDAKGTYDADTAFVYHFAERGAPASDATTNGNTSQTAGAAEGAQIAGGVRLIIGSQSSFSRRNRSSGARMARSHFLPGSSRPR